MKKQKLTPKQRKFADEYVKTGNATKSAIAAGYSARTAREIGKENLTKPYIKLYVEKQSKKIEDHKIMKAKEALQGITSIARGEAKTIAHAVVNKTMVSFDVLPTITERERAYEDILKRYPVSDIDRATIRKAQAEAIKAETEAKLAKQQIDDHDTASGQVVEALKHMPKDEIIAMARKIAGEQDADDKP